MDKYRIGVVGWYNYDNCGDESYKLSFPTIFPQHDFAFGNTPPKDVDFYVLGGGDVVAPYFVDSLVATGKPLHLMSATISQDVPLDKFRSIVVRDQNSFEKARLLHSDVTLAPDFAFALKANATRGGWLIEDLFKGRSLYQKVVVVVLNGHLLPSNGTPAWKNTNSESLFYGLAEVADRTDASFLFLPFGMQPLPQDDRVANAWCASKCKYWNKNAVIFHRLDVQDTIDIIAASNAVISSRLHSTIFSCITGTPFVDITHNHKNASFLRDVGLSRLSLHYPGLGTDELHESLNYLLKNPDEIQQELRVVASRETDALAKVTGNFRFV